MDLDAIEAALAAMSPEPWERDYGGVVGHIKSVAARDCGYIPTVAMYDVPTRSLSDEDKIANATGIVLLRNAAPEMTRRIREQDAEIARLQSAVHELEDMVSAAESRANERSSTIAELRSLCGDAIEWIGNHQPDIAPESLVYLMARLRAAWKGEQ